MILPGAWPWAATPLEKHLPGIFIRRVEEPAQSSVLRRVELPQIKIPLLAREDPADEHDLDHVDELDFLAYHILDIGLESCWFWLAVEKKGFPFLLNFSVT